MEVLQLGQAAEALDEVGDALREAGAEGELSDGILRRLAVDPCAWGDEVTILVARGASGPAALVTMTGVFPALIVGFSEPAAVPFTGLVDTMLAAGRPPTGVNGARRWVEPFARAWRAAGATVEPHREVLAYQLTAVRPPTAPPAGRFRVADAADAGLLERWVRAFSEEIGEPATSEQAAGTVQRLRATDDLVVWEREREVVSMAAVVRRTPWSSSVAYVYTPPGLRGQGFASVVVAMLSQRELDAGRRWCSLFTDMANPTSNHIYAQLGYEPRCEFRHLSLIWP